MDSCQVLIFGDLTGGSCGGLQSLLVIKEHPLLTSFFERVAFALRSEIGRLNFSQRQEGGWVKFTTLLELVSRVKAVALPHPALEVALSCIYHFASVIAHYSEAGRSFPTATDTRVVGLCTGTLTSAALSCSRSVQDLLVLAVQTVRVAFKTGLCVSEVRNRIELQNGATSWSVVIPGIDPETANGSLNRFCSDQVLPTASRPYISAHSSTGTTLSGPPQILNKLLQSAKYLPNSTSLPLKVRAPYHAPHLYDTTDIENILQFLIDSGVAGYKSKITTVSSRKGIQGPGIDFIFLLQSALIDILIEPLEIEKLAEAISADIENHEFSRVTIKPVSTSAFRVFTSSINSERATVSVDGSMKTPAGFKLPTLSENGHLGHSRLAIIGYSGRFPDANSPDEFWTLLREGRDVAKVTPTQRWDVNTHVDPTLKRKNTSGTPYGCWLNEPGYFDARFFNMSPREAPQVDPAQRLALMTAYEAMENAGMVPDTTPSTQRDRVGVFYGTTSNDWGETNSSQDVDTYYIPGSCRAFIPGRQNFFFKFSGPSYSVDTACSSSLAAMHLACNALWRGDIDTAISGGTNVMTNPDITAGLDRGHFLSRTGNCKTFDDAADGYCRGEGVVTTIIKRLEDAVADNDPILAVILDASTNHSAEAESITRPHVGAQKAIFEKVLNNSAVDPSTVGYIEMHGTGTQAGDAREMKSVLSIFGQEPRKQPLYLGSAKANVGHGESVSGVIALTKVLMMMEKNEIPPHCGIKTKINTGFPNDLTDRNILIADKPTAWPREKGQVRRALINNFSAAGGNSSVLIEDAPIIAKTKIADPRSVHMVTLSAKSNTALFANVSSMIAFLENSKPLLSDLSYTTTARRTHHRHRLVVTGSNLTEVTTQLSKKLVSIKDIQPKQHHSVTFAFTGQGSQYPGMAKDLLRFESFRRDMERLDSIARKQNFPTIMPLISAINGDISEFEPLVVQVANTCVQMSMARLWKSWGISPSAVVGHSLGEYAALNIAGVLSDVDTIYLTGKRAELLQEKCTRDTHSMLAVAVSVNELGKMLTGIDYEIACKNAPSETVLSGSSANIDLVIDRLSAAGFKKTRLNVPYAFHSSQVEPILESFIEVARGVTFHEPKIPVLSPLLASLVTSGGVFGASYLAKHCRETVDFVGALEAAKSGLGSDKSTWIEIGPHPVLVGLLKANLGPATILPTLQRNKDTWKVLAGSLSALYESGADIKWNECQRDFAAPLNVIKLPSYNWDLKNYWMQYVNDWSLYKGDAAFLNNRPPACISTTCVQSLVEEKMEGAKFTIIGQSDLLREDLDPFVRGHRVNGVALCTPSVYAEMALILGDHLRKKESRWEGCIVDVQHMDVQKPLAVVSKGNGPQYLRCQVVLNTVDGKGAVEFYSVTPEGKRLTKHAECSVVFVNAAEAAAETKSSATAILTRMDQLRQNVASDEHVQKLRGSSGYQLVSSLASYDDDYRGVDEVILDSKNLEAVAKIKFGESVIQNNARGIFHIDPYLIDNFGQPALFVMNANDKADLSKEVFVNHGWTSLHFYKEVSIKKVYRSYVKMQGPQDDGMYSGDMTVFEGNEIVACYRGVKAQGVPRRLMDYIVKMRDDTQTDLPRAVDRQQRATTTAVTHAGQTAISVNVVVDANSDSHSWEEALNIIAEESGVPVEELTPNKAFADLGIDSLLSLLCASRFREELGMIYESTIFEEYPTVQDLKAFWEKSGATGNASAVTGRDAILDSMFHDTIKDDKEDSTSIGSDSSSNSSSPRSSGITTDSESAVTKPDVAASSLLLQGNPLSPNTTQTLFLLPDGSGSAYSYASIPLVDKSLAIVALNCPWMRTPVNYPQGIDRVTNLYVAEIRRRQPHGPYALGGWSVGGIFAYACAQALSSQGEAVSQLLLLDCPVPHGLDRLPTRYFEYCNSIGLLGAVHAGTGLRREPPGWLVSHFEACVESLHDHIAAPFEPISLAPKTHIVWASDSIDAHVETKFERLPQDPAGLKFLTEERVDFGPCGWDTLLPFERISITNMCGANHFSMMKDDHAVELARIIRSAIMT